MMNNYLLGGNHYEIFGAWFDPNEDPATTVHKSDTWAEPLQIRGR